MARGLPRVTTRVADRTTRVATPGGGGLRGCVVVDARKGPVDEPTLVRNEAEYLRTFCVNNTVERDGDFNGHWSALNFLRGGGELYVVRPERTGWTARAAGLGIKATSQTAGAVANLSPGSSDMDGVDIAGATDTVFDVYAKSYGAWGDGLSVEYNIEDGHGLDDIVYLPLEAFAGYTDAVLTTNGTTSATVMNIGDSIPVEVFDVDFVNPNDTKTYTAITKHSTEAAATAAGANNYFFDRSTSTVKFGAATTVAAGAARLKLTVRKVAELVVYYDADDGRGAQEVDRFFVSLDRDKKDGYGNSVYVDDVYSEHVGIDIGNKTGDKHLPANDFAAVSLDGGADATDAQLTNGTKLANADLVAELKDTDVYQFKLLMDGGNTESAFLDSLLEIAEARDDALVIASIKRTSQASVSGAADSIEAEHTNANSRFVTFYTPNVIIYDRFNDREVSVSPDGIVGGIMARNARSQGKNWVPPAGYEFGLVNSIRRLERRYSTSGATGGPAGTIYDYNVNPIVFKSGVGPVIMGQKTSQKRPSATDRVNVQLLLITIMPDLKRFLEQILFRPNTPTVNDGTTRALVKTRIDSYMERVQVLQGVNSFTTICDETNNTPLDVDNQVLNVDVEMNPTGAVEYINLTGVLTPSGARVGLR